MRTIAGVTFICSLFLALSVYAASNDSDKVVISGDGAVIVNGERLETDQMEEIEEALSEGVEALPLKSSTVEIDDINLTTEELTKRLILLEEEGSVMRDKLKWLDERLGFIEKNVAELDKMQRAQKEETYYNKIRKHFDRVKARLGTKIFIITITSLILAVLSLLYLLIAPRCRKKPSDDSYPHSGDEHEVGFTEGVDVTASELNLARAYIEMGDEERAKPMLMRILLHGNDYEQAEAKELLNQMKEG